MKDNKIKEVIEELRPYLNLDGGDIEFIKYNEDTKILYVKLLGACSMCMHQDSTLEDSLLTAIKEKVPEVESIINTPL